MFSFLTFNVSVYFRYLCAPFFLLQAIPTSDQHEAIYDGNDSTFGGMRWSPDETRLVYTAEMKYSEASSFFDPEGSAKRCV